jgi:colanic acid/amylovoran biosynthesis glycosyltransferase
MGMPKRRLFVMSKRPVSIAYVSHSFPLLTETFVYREVFGLERKGIRVVNFAIWKPNKQDLSQEVRHLVDSSHYVFPIPWPEFIKAHLFFLFSRPYKYLSTLFSVLTRRGESAVNRRRTFFHFCDAVYLAMEMKRQRIEHIHAHFAINAATIALVASRLLDITYSFTAHNSFFIDRVILEEKIRRARFIVAISEFTREYLIRLSPGDNVADKIHIVHYGLSPDDFKPSDPKPVSDIPVLLFVAQLSERKGTPVLIEACRILAERGVSFRCVVVGDGPQRGLVQQLVEEYGLQEIVELPGAVFQEHLRDYLRQANVFVLPCVTASNGDMDGIPNSLMEAMAMEIATVSTYVSGIPELIEDGVSGLLVPEKDALALADALQGLLEDDELRLRLGRNGREKVVREFNVDKSTAQLSDLFIKYLKADHTSQ